MTVDKIVGENYPTLIKTVIGSVLAYIGNYALEGRRLLVPEACLTAYSQLESGEAWLHTAMKLCSSCRMFRLNHLGLTHSVAGNNGRRKIQIAQFDCAL